MPADAAPTADLETVIGLEIHAQLNTATKLFCDCSNDDFNAQPNTLICPVCTAQPGALPVPSSQALQKAAIAALALGCQLAPESVFARKNYFYPDLPAGYQISQFDQPLATGGRVELPDGSSIALTRVHVENDAGKLTHRGDRSLIDFNRAGSPLIEIVSEPELRSSDQAASYAKVVQQIVQFAGSCNADMYRGQLRFDASVSLRPVGSSTLNPRAEIKNLNSFRALAAAVEYEIGRQRTLWQAGTPPDDQTTVGWDESRGQTFLMRSKESAADYRYFPEPDLPSVQFTPEQIDTLRAAVPALPAERADALTRQHSLPAETVEQLMASPELVDYFEQVTGACGDAPRAASWILVELMARVNDSTQSFADQRIPASDLAELIRRIGSNEISGAIAKSVFAKMWDSGQTPGEIIAREGLAQICDESAIAKLVEQVIHEHSQVVEQIRGGREAALGFLVGQLMKASRGQANPELASRLLKAAILG